MKKYCENNEKSITKKNKKCCKNNEKSTAKIINSTAKLKKNLALILF
jgi:hypothetical protein